MKNKDKKMMLFVIATIVTSLGIGYTLLRGTRATTELPPNEAFADINFYKCIVDTYNNKNLTEYDYTTYSLTDEELQSISVLWCRSTDISDVKGIEKLTNLTNLDLSSANIKNIDLAGLVNLTKLDLAYNDLESIDLSNNVLLTNLDLSDNNVSTIDISKNVSLVTLDLGSNYLNELDVSYNANLADLNIGDNMISELDLSNNLVLENLNISKTKISEIDLSNNKELKRFEKWNNCNTTDKGYQLVGGGCSYYEKTINLDISQNEKLETLILGYNDLDVINLNNNVNLKKLELQDCNITSIDLSKNVNLESVRLSDKYTTIDFSKNVKLKSIYLDSDTFDSIDISKNVNLESLTMTNSTLKSIDTSNNVNLKLLNLSSNDITSVDLSKNVLLNSLYLNYNELKKIDLSNNVNLQSLGLSNNYLTEIDLSKNNLLNDLRINNNSFNENVYFYKNSDIQLGTNVMLPESLDWSTPVWTSDNDNVIKVEDNGLINALGAGMAVVTGTLESKYTNVSTVNVVEIKSEKYIINESDNYIYIGTETDVDTILGNINYPESIHLDIDLENNKLKVMYQDNILKEFTILRLSSDKYDLNNSYIYTGFTQLNVDDIETNANKLIEDHKLLVKYEEDILSEFDIVYVSTEKYDIKGKYIYVPTVEESSYSDFINYIVVSENISYKLFYENNEVTDGLLSDGMILKIYSAGEEIDEYIIADDYVDFGQSIIVDEDNLILYNLQVGSYVSQIISLVDTNGSVNIYDKDDSLIIDETSKLKTGDKLKIEFSDSALIYTISVAGDVDEDGDIGPADLKKVSEYLLDNSIISEEVYLMASDYDGNGSININDVIKMTDYYIDNLNNG